MAARPYITDPQADLEGVRPQVRDAFVKMAQEFYDLTGQQVYVSSGYRSSEKQASLYKAYIADPLKTVMAAPPGRSMHEYGYALDIASSAADRMASIGLLDKYGFWRPLMQSHIRNKEPWHIEPKGLVYSAIRATGYTPVRLSLLLLVAGLLYLLFSRKGRRT